MTDRKPVKMEKPVHGKGLLKRGGNWGNKSKTGMKDPKTEIRNLFLGILQSGLEEAEQRIEAMRDERISRIFFEHMTRDELIEFICDRVWLSWAELQQLIDVTAKYGIGTQQTINDQRDPISVAVLKVGGGNGADPGS